MKYRSLPIILVFVTGLCAFQLPRFQQEKISKPWPKPIYDFSFEPQFKARVALGRILFYDPVLSADSTISCASCHLQYTAFAHVDHALSHGIHDSIATRNATALMNLAWHKQLMWDGAIHHIDVQALAPIHHPAEMGSSIDEVVSKLNQIEKYKPLFNAAFGDNKATGERVLTAISRFMTVIVSNQSKYDSVMRGSSVFTSQEKRGYALFQKHCNACHTEPLFTSLKYEDNGLPVNSQLRDLGRYKITQIASDSFKFKVPTLRNIEYSFPYMHDGRFDRLSEVFNHYEKGIVKRKGISVNLKTGIKLNAKEKVDITAFLLTLTDKHYLYNPEWGFPKK